MGQHHQVGLRETPAASVVQLVLCVRRYSVSFCPGFNRRNPHSCSRPLHCVRAMPDRTARVVGRTHSSIRWCSCGRFVAAACWCSITLRKRNVPLENGKCSDRVHRCSDVRPPCSSSVLIPANGPNVEPVQLLGHPWKNQQLAMSHRLPIQRPSSMAWISQ